MQSDPTITQVIRRHRQEPTARRTVFRFLETSRDDDKASKAIDIALIVLISASVIAVVLESMPEFEARYSARLYWFEVFTVSVFTVEYLLRVWSSVERHETAPKSAFASRLRFMFSFHAIIDLLAILPFYLLTFGIFGQLDMRFLRAFRLLRVLKLTRYSSALNMLIITINQNLKALAAAFLILVTTMLLAASGMYYFERHSQPDAFGSIPAAMWWAFSTLTTVGYGDVTPITNGGKIFGAMITVVGIGMVALPTSILATGYASQLETSKRKYKDLAEEALDDGILTDDEINDLESFRIDLGLSRQHATRILDEKIHAHALAEFADAGCCPHCGKDLPEQQTG